MQSARTNAHETKEHGEQLRAEECPPPDAPPPRPRASPVAGGAAHLVGDIPPHGVARHVLSFHAHSFALIALLSGLAVPALAQTPKPDIKGLYLMSDYPALSVQAGTTTTVNMH